MTELSKFHMDVDYKKQIQGGIPNENSTQHFSFKHTP